MQVFGSFGGWSCWPFAKDVERNFCLGYFNVQVERCVTGTSEVSWEVLLRAVVLWEDSSPGHALGVAPFGTEF